MGRYPYIDTLVARSRSFGSWAMVAILTLGPLQAQQNQPNDTFKVEATTVVVDMIVTDHKGHHVHGLKAEDFGIAEDGSPQRIVSFTEARSANEQAESNSAEPPAVRTEATPAAVAPQRPHLLTVVMDLSDSRPENLRKSCETVIKYLEKNLTPNDYVAIYYIDRTLRLGLPFTNDMAQAKAALTKLSNSTATSALSPNDRSVVQREINELYAQIHPDAQLGVSGEAPVISAGRGNTNPGNLMDPLISSEIDTLRMYLDVQNGLQAKAVFVALRAICLSYRDIPGRKNVVMFSEGFLYSDDSRPEMESVADAANRANVALYVIDPTGLEISGGILGKGSDTEVSQMISIANQGAGHLDEGGARNRGTTKFDQIKSIGDSSRNSQLAWLADVTGGLMVKNTNDLLPVFSKVVEDARDFYSISYQPSNKAFDGKFRKIKVELAQKGYELRYRQGYWAIPHGQAVTMTPAAAQMLSNTNAPGFKSSFDPQLYANLLMSPDGHFVAPVSVTFSGSKVPLEKIEDNFKSNVTLVVVARDPQGKILSVHQRDWPFQIEKKNKDEFSHRDLTLQTQVSVNDLTPITVQAVISMPGGVLASVGKDVKVSDPLADGPHLTSLMLTTQAEQATCTDKADPLCLDNVRLIQPAKALFAANGRLIVYFTANGLSLDPQTQKPRIGVDLKLRSGTGSNGDFLKAPAAENVQALPGPTSGSVMVLAEFDLKSLGKGNYTLQATASDMVKKTSSKGEAAFAVQ
jgi:VWFA-related protein